MSPILRKIELTVSISDGVLKCPDLYWIICNPIVFSAWINIINRIPRTIHIRTPRVILLRQRVHRQESRNPPVHLPCMEVIQLQAEHGFLFLAPELVGLRNLPPALAVADHFPVGVVVVPLHHLPVGFGHHAVVSQVVPQIKVVNSSLNVAIVEQNSFQRSVFIHLVARILSQPAGVCRCVGGSIHVFLRVERKARMPLVGSLQAFARGGILVVDGAEDGGNFHLRGHPEQVVSVSCTLVGVGSHRPVGVVSVCTAVRVAHKARIIVGIQVPHVRYVGDLVAAVGYVDFLQREVFEPGEGGHVSIAVVTVPGVVCAVVCLRGIVFPPEEALPCGQPREVVVGVVEPEVIIPQVPHGGGNVAVVAGCAAFKGDVVIQPLGEFLPCYVRQPRADVVAVGQF